MDRETIRREVERLAPWFYSFDLEGVRTDATMPCDHAGHRKVAMPVVREGFWRGKTVLDIGCAEGALGFGALDQGASEVLAVDTRPSHVEKGRFVAKIKGYDRIRFEVGSADRWPDQHSDLRFDVVIFCGLIYHLQEPWETVRKYCDIAGEAILVTSVLWGGEDGWTLWKELDTIGASEDVLDSLMPNNVNTIVAEFRKHGFTATHVYETGHLDFDAGCALLFERSSDFPVEHLETTGDVPEMVDVHVGRPPGVLTISLHNRNPEAWNGQGTLELADAEGNVLLRRGPVPLAFPARRTGSSRDACTSLDFREGLAGMPPEGVATARVLIEDAQGQVVRDSRFLIGC